MSEKQLTYSIIDILSLQFKGRIKVWRNNTGALPTQSGGFVKFGEYGSPDILGILEGGRFLALEVKLPKGKVTEHQEAWLAEAKRLGAIVSVVRSVDEAIKIVKEALAIPGTDTKALINIL